MPAGNKSVPAIVIQLLKLQYFILSGRKVASFQNFVWLSISPAAAIMKHAVIADAFKLATRFYSVRGNGIATAPLPRLAGQLCGYISTVSSRCVGCMKTHFT